MQKFFFLSKTVIFSYTVKIFFTVLHLNIFKGNRDSQGTLN